MASSPATRLAILSALILGITIFSDARPPPPGSYQRPGGYVAPGNPHYAHHGPAYGHGFGPGAVYHYPPEYVEVIEPVVIIEPVDAVDRFDVVDYVDVMQPVHYRDSVLVDAGDAVDVVEPVVVEEHEVGKPA